MSCLSSNDLFVSLGRWMIWSQFRFITNLSLNTWQHLLRLSNMLIYSFYSYRMHQTLLIHYKKCNENFILIIYLSKRWCKVLTLMNMTHYFQKTKVNDCQNKLTMKAWVYTFIPEVEFQIHLIKMWLTFNLALVY